MEIETEKRVEKIAPRVCEKVVLIFEHVLEKERVKNSGKLRAVF